MVEPTKVGPLAWNVPIAYPNGNPTPYFVRQLEVLLAEKAVTDALAEGAVPNTRILTAGAGLTGGGDLTVDRTFDVGAGTGITVNANDVAINITDEAERIRDVIGTALVAGSNITITVNDGADTITIAASGGSATHRGALVKKSADQTGANYSALTAVAWTAESYDTDGFHDNVTNNTRLTVPTGVSYVRLSGAIRVANMTSTDWMFLRIHKNGSAVWDGNPTSFFEVGQGTASVSIHSAVVAVSSGDYFELMFQNESDTSIDISAAASWFAIEAVQ